MCAIPDCEEFITEFCEFPFFVTEFSARFVALLGESHFFSLNSVTFLTLIFCSYNFALNSVNFLAPT